MNELSVVDEMKREQVDLVKQTVARGCSDTELSLFLYTAKRTGLDPLLRQVHAVKRWDSKAGKEVMTIQTGIDGYRLIADRTMHYAPGKEPTFTYDKDGKLSSATAYVKKKTQDGEWHECAATAHYDEYVQRTKTGEPNSMWAKLPRVMLAKCAEANALRKAFPAQLSGIYTNEEMMQADNETDKPKPVQGSIRERVMKQVELKAEPVEEAGPLPASVPPSHPPVALPPPSCEPDALQTYQRGILKTVKKANTLTKKGNKPWGDIEFEMMDGTTVAATWFNFSDNLTYDEASAMIGEQIDFSVTPASNPRYKPTLEHFYPVVLEGPVQ